MASKQRPSINMKRLPEGQLPYFCEIQIKAPEREWGLIIDGGVDMENDILALVPAMTTRKRIQNHKNKYCRK